MSGRKLLICVLNSITTCNDYLKRNSPVLYSHNNFQRDKDLFFQKIKNLNKMFFSDTEFQTACTCHVTYAFRRESTLHIWLNVKELFAWNRRDIWSLTDFSLAKWLSVRLRTKWLWVRVQLQSLCFRGKFFNNIRNSGFEKDRKESIMKNQKFLVKCIILVYSAGLIFLVF